MSINEINKAAERVLKAKEHLAARHDALRDAESARVSASCELSNAQNELGKLLEADGLIGGDYELAKPERGIPCG